MRLLGMNFKTIWFPISAVLGVINLAAAGYALGLNEPQHAGVHVLVAFAFGAWAWHLRRAPAAGGETQTRIDELEAEVGDLRQSLSEAQERLDFAERLLSQTQDARRVGPDR